ncbi:MAG: hypothetical protein AB7F49_27180 [Pseudorhodoplanes sp.]
MAETPEARDACPMFIDYLRIAKQTELKPHNRLQRRGIIVTMIIQRAVFLQRQVVEVLGEQDRR